MKRRFLLAAMGMAAALMTGCADGDYGKYADTLKEHSIAESNRIAAQSQAISSMVALANPSTPMEGTLLAVIGMMQVERLQSVPLPIVKPTTGMDVLNTATGHLPMAFMGLSNWGIAREGFKMAGSTNTFNGDATLNDSMNKTYTTQTGSGDGSAITATAGVGNTENAPEEPATEKQP